MTSQTKGMTTKFRAAAILGLVILGAMLLWGFGCSRTNNQSAGGEGLSWLGVRPASGDTTRLLRNAHYLKMMGRPEMALKELEAAYQQNPRNLQVLDTLARNYEEMGEFNRAQRLYQEALALDGSNQGLNNNLCFSYYLAGQWDKAEACFRQALAKNPQNIMARNNLGLLLCRRGRGEEARRLWQEAEGEMAANKKMEQVMVALAPGESLPYAQRPQPPAAPVQTASSPEKEPLTPKPEAAREMAAAPAPVPAASPSPPPAPVTPASKPQEPEKPVAKPAPAPAPAPVKTASLPAAPAPKAMAPEKLAAKPVLPQPQAQPAAPKTKNEPPAPKTLAKPGPAASPEKIATQRPAPAAPAQIAPKPEKLAAKPAPGPAKPQPVTAPPKMTPEAEKKAAPAAAPGPLPKQLKTQVAAAPVPAPVTPEKAAKESKPGIEVLNGSPTKKLAHQTRTMLAQEGYRVVSIGNHVDFGVEETTISYRPGAEAAARAMGAKFFPQARWETGTKFAKNADIRVTLGKDLLTLPALAAKAIPTAEKVAAKTAAEQPEPKAAAPPPASPPAAAKAPAPAAPAPKLAAAPPASDKTPRPYLTAQELETMAIDIRNGTRAKDLAHRTRAMLSQEGFQVASIGNHIDFGAEKTIIYYRPGAEKMARNLSSRFFPNSRLEPTAKLKGDVDIKVLLGKDMLEQPDVMARLSD